MDGDVLDSSMELVEILKNAQSFLDEIKTAQRLGADNIKIKVNQSAGAFDKSVTVPWGSYTLQTITFTADHQDYAFTEAEFVFYKDGTAPADKLTSQSGDLFIIERISTNARQTVWELRFANLENDSLSHTYYIKAIISSTDTGVIS